MDVQCDVHIIRLPAFPKVHLDFYRNVLVVKKSIPRIVIYHELGIASPGTLCNIQRLFKYRKQLNVRYYKKRRYKDVIYSKMFIDCASKPDWYNRTGRSSHL